MRRKSVDDLPDDVPLFIARAGRDEMPGLNETLDRFAAKALDRNLPITMVNHANGPHAFDLVDDSDMSHEIYSADPRVSKISPDAVAQLFEMNRTYSGRSGCDRVGVGR